MGITIFRGKNRVINESRIIPPPIPVTAEIMAVKNEKTKMERLTPRLIPIMVYFEGLVNFFIPKIKRDGF